MPPITYAYDPRYQYLNLYLVLLLANGVLPEGQPSDGLVMSDFFPRLPGIRMRRDRFPRPDIDRDVPRINALLDLAHPRVLASAAEQTWGLNSEVTDLWVTVNQVT